MTITENSNRLSTFNRSRIRRRNRPLCRPPYLRSSWIAVSFFWMNSKWENLTFQLFLNWKLPRPIRGDVRVKIVRGSFASIWIWWRCLKWQPVFLDCTYPKNRNSPIFYVLCSSIVCFLLSSFKTKQKRRIITTLFFVCCCFFPIVFSLNDSADCVSLLMFSTTHLLMQGVDE